MPSVKPFKARVITISTRAAQGIWEDTSGPYLVQELKKLAIDCDAPVVIADGPEITTELKKAIASKFDLVLTNGGTGLSPTDITPELTSALLEKPSPGINEAIRLNGLNKKVFFSSLSRGVSGVSGKTLVINLPGSLNGVKDAMEVLKEILPHALSQIAGEDHQRHG